MPLKTRLDNRSEGNNKLAIVDSVTGGIIAMITTTSNKTELEITTVGGLHVEKPNGFSSRK